MRKLPILSVLMSETASFKNIFPLSRGMSPWHASAQCCGLMFLHATTSLTRPPKAPFKAVGGDLSQLWKVVH